jgi:hypothetical protein
MTGFIAGNLERGISVRNLLIQANLVRSLLYLTRQRYRCCGHAVDGIGVQKESRTCKIPIYSDFVPESRLLMRLIDSSLDLSSRLLSSHFDDCVLSLRPCSLPQVSSACQEGRRSARCCS